MPLPISGQQQTGTTSASSSADLHEPLLSPSLSSDDIEEQEELHDNDVPSSDAETTPTPMDLWDGLPRRQSVLIKSLYFLDALSSSTWGRFSAIYYHVHGLSPTQIGGIEGLRTFLPTLVMPLWGIWSDAHQCPKSVWLGTKTVSTLVLLTLATPYVYESFARILTVSIVATCFVSSGILDAYTLDLLGRAPTPTPTNISNSSNNETDDSTNSSKNNQLYYGRYRLYASLSWGLGSLIMGIVTDHYGFEPNFILFGILGGCMIVMVATQIPNDQNLYGSHHETGDMVNTDEALEIPPSPLIECSPDCNTNSMREPLLPSNHEDGSNTMESSTVASTRTPEVESSMEQAAGSVYELLELALRPRVFSFLTQVVIMGAAMATVERLLFLYVVNDLQASTTLCGISVAVNVIFELPIFWYAKPLVECIGHDGLFLISMACFVIRVYGYTLLTPSTASYLLVLEVMHGVTFACFWIVTTDLSKVLIHQTKSAYWKTAIPSLIQMMYSALGVSIGSVVGGWAMHRYGSRIMYRGTALLVAVTWAVQLAGTVYCRIQYQEQRDRRNTGDSACNGSFLPNYGIPRIDTRVVRAEHVGRRMEEGHSERTET